jgi:hypothetical protein
MVVLVYFLIIPQAQNIPNDHCGHAGMITASIIIVKQGKGVSQKVKTG